jgi:aryl-alcohol dehydrogenase-like predicted oxidoreductase
MDYRQLGNSGVRVSVIGLGGGRFFDGQIRKGKAAAPGFPWRERSLRPGDDGPQLQHRQEFSTWADVRGRRINELAQVWLLAQPQVCSVIPGATKVEQVLSNVDGANWLLTAEECKEVSASLEGSSPDSP